MTTRIKKLITLSVSLIVNLIYGFGTLYIFPTLLLFAFNRSKGAVNNPDGELFIPFAWFLLILIPALFIIINLIITKKIFSSRKYIILFIAAFIIGGVFGVITTNATYSTNYTNILIELLK